MQDTYCPNVVSRIKLTTLACMQVGTEISILSDIYLCKIQEGMKAAILRDLDPKTISEEMNEYILKNGTLIIIRYLLNRVAPTHLHSVDYFPFITVIQGITHQIITPRKRPLPSQHRPRNIV